MENFLAGDLTIDVAQAPAGDVVLTWRGKSNDRDPGVLLMPFFDAVVAAANRTGHGIEMRFQELEYFNSSTITALVRFMRTLHSLNLKLTVQYDGRVRSQKLSFEALRPLEALGHAVTVIDVAETPQR